MSDTINKLLADEIGDAHESFTAVTPLREDAFDLSNDEKIATIAEHVEGILNTLGMDLAGPRR